MVAKNKMYTDSGRYVAELLPEQSQIVLHDRKKADCVVNRLFRRKNDYNPKYFQPVDIQSQDYQVWAVSGDSILPKENISNKTQ